MFSHTPSSRHTILRRKLVFANLNSMIHPSKKFFLVAPRVNLACVQTCVMCNCDRPPIGAAGEKFCISDHQSILTQFFREISCGRGVVRSLESGKVKRRNEMNAKLRKSIRPR